MVQLRLNDSKVSAEHASIYFSGGKWKVRDLASRNGTLLDGVLLTPGKPYELPRNARLRFGGVGSEWVLEDDCAPGPTAQVGVKRIQGEMHVLWLPDTDDPSACVVREGAGWFLEHEQTRKPVHHGEEIVVNEISYRLELPDVLESTSTSTHHSTHEGGNTELVLEFAVSQDEEHVALSVVSAESRIDLGARAHNYALLELARQFIADVEASVGLGEAGWVYPQDLCEKLGLDREALNLQLWRARQHLKKCGGDALALIERRPDAGQLRLGLSPVIRPAS